MKALIFVALAQFGACFALAIWNGSGLVSLMVGLSTIFLAFKIAGKDAEP